MNRSSISPEGAVVDTNVLSCIHNQHSTLGPRCEELLTDYRVIVPFVVFAEMWRGAELAKWGARRRRKLRRFLEQFEDTPPNRALCEVWAHNYVECARRGRTLPWWDSWVAATALHLSAPLVTRNVREFEGIPGLEIIAV